MDHISFLMPSNSRTTLLEAPFHEHEIEKVALQFGSWKTRGHDGLQASSIGAFWKLMSFIWFNNHYQVKFLSILSRRSNIGPIPKVNSQNSPMDFRPAHLCNVIIKLWARLLPIGLAMWCSKNNFHRKKSQLILKINLNDL